MNEEIIELEIKEEPGGEEKPEKASKMPKIEGAVPATAGLKIVLKNPKISIDKLILKKKE